MTILEWMRASTRYAMDDNTLEKIASDRFISDVSASSDGLTEKQKELLTADIIFTAIVLSPSSVSSHSEQHNGFQRTVGAETDNSQRQKITYAKLVYKKYDDPKFDILAETNKQIRLIPITDTL
jgi:hypothetical protein